MNNKKSIHVDVEAISDTGVVRDHNEDEFLIIPDLSSSINSDDINTNVGYDVPLNGSLYIVVDGMGGGNIGEVAASLTIETIYSYFNENISQLIEEGFNEVIQVFFNKAIQYCNEKLSRQSQGNKEMMGIGSSVVFTWVRGDQAYIGWVGNCRAYYYDSVKLELLTEDHTLENELIEKGDLHKFEDNIDTQYHIINQILGSYDKIIVPGFCVKTMNEEGKLLLVSDGVHGLISDREIEECFTQHVKGGNITRDLINKVNDHGGYDNITVLVCEVIDTNVLVEEKVYEEPKSQTLKRVIVFTVIVVSVLVLLFAL